MVAQSYNWSYKLFGENLDCFFLVSKKYICTTKSNWERLLYFFLDASDFIIFSALFWFNICNIHFCKRNNKLFRKRFTKRKFKASSWNWKTGSRSIWSSWKSWRFSEILIPKSVKWYWRPKWCFFLRAILRCHTKMKELWTFNNFMALKN